MIPWENQLKEMAEDVETHLGGYTEDQRRAFFADESEYTPEEKKSYKQAGKAASKYGPEEYSNALAKWRYERALKLGLDSSISVQMYDALRYARQKLQEPKNQQVLAWQEEAMTLMGFAPDPTLDYAGHASNMRKALKEEQDDLRAKQYALQVKQFFLRLDPRRAKMFVLELTGTERGDWQKLFGHLDEIPDQPTKRLNPSYEKSKAFARTIRATKNLERAILAASKAYDDAKEWNKFLDDKARLPVPALPPAKTPKALAIGESA